MSINQKKLEGKVALITGGSSGIGLATAQRYLDEGAKVYITGRDGHRLEEASKELNGKAVCIQADSSNLSDIKKTADILREKEGKLDVLFVNAGIAKFAPSSDVNEDAFNETFDINVKGAFFTVQTMVPLLSKGSSVILNGTFLIFKGLAGSSVYTASKAALVSFAKTLSSELIDQEIRINVVNTGPTATPIYGKTGLPQEVVDQLGAQIANDVPLKRFGRPDEIANVATFLASDESSYMVGSQITVDGGYTEL